MHRQIDTAHMSEYGVESPPHSLGIRGEIGIHAPKSIEEQESILHDYFPDLPKAYAAARNIRVPDRADGVFVIPPWEYLAPNYSDALSAILGALEKSRNGKFYNWRTDRMGSEHLEIDRQTKRAIDRLKRHQPEGLLLMPAQCGHAYSGHSVNDARAHLAPHEFGLPAYAVGVILLSHPHLLRSINDLAMICTGDQLTDTIGNWACTPLFYVSYDTLTFGTLMNYFVDSSCGAATGFTF